MIEYLLKTALTILLLFIVTDTFAQHPGSQQRKSQHSSGNGEIFGQALDSLSNEPIEYVTISLIQMSNDSIVTGTVTNGKGKFNLEGIAYGNYKIRFDFVGYKPKTIENITVNEKNLIHDLKSVNIFSSIQLGEVTIDGKKPAISYEIDKKVINVSDQDTETGQSAIQVLETIPSIDIGIDGNVSLRGSQSFTLLIDGKPSALSVTDALNSIPASAIENIEIITNASAKYEAEGVSGIINIILKKKKLEGSSLLANVSYGNFNNHSANISINHNQNKWSFNVNGSISAFNRPRTLSSQRTSFNDSITTVVNSTGDDFFKHGFNKIGTEISFSPNSAHSLTFGTEVGHLSIDNGGEIHFTERQNSIITSEYDNVEYAIRDFNTFRSFLTYRHNIKRDTKHYLELTTLYRTREGDETAITEFYNLNNELTRATKYTETGPTSFIRFNIDYSKSFSNNNKFEIGSQIQFGTSGDDGKNYNLDIDSQEFVLNPIYSSQVDYTRDIMALYTLYKGKENKLGYQVGLRAEKTIRNITADNFSDFTNINRIDFFPSAHLSYSLPKEQQLMLSYSRRINRPRSWYFEPFLTWQTAYQLRQGNPDLLPEYINAFELNWNKALGEKGNVSIETYFRKIENVILRVNEVFEDNILITKPHNIGESISFGAEPSISYKISKWWRANLGVNLYSYSLTGQISDEPFDQDAFVWSSKMSNTFTFGEGWKFQISPQYTGATITPQGTAKAIFRTNTSLKKTLHNGMYSFGLQARDVFSTSKREVESTVGTVLLHTIREPRTPFVSVNFSLKLNNYQRKMGRRGMEDDF